MIIVQKEWEEYLAKVYSKGITPEQATHIQRSFYAGALIVYLQVKKLAELEEEVGIEILDALETELVAWMKERLKVDKAMGATLD